MVIHPDRCILTKQGSLRGKFQNNLIPCSQFHICPSSHIPKLGTFRCPIFPISYNYEYRGPYSFFRAHMPYSEFFLRHIPCFHSGGLLNLATTDNRLNETMCRRRLMLDDWFGHFELHFTDVLDVVLLPFTLSKTLHRNVRSLTPCCDNVDSISE